MKILVADDLESIRNVFDIILKRNKQDVLFKTKNAQETLEVAKKEQPNIVFLDIKLPDKDGTEIIPELKNYADHIIVITGHASVQNAVNTLKMGIYDYLEKPFEAQKIELIIKNIRNEMELLKKIGQLEEESLELIGDNPKIEKIRLNIPKIAQSDATVLIQGENGTGKEIVARLIYKYSKTKGPFIVLNCAALPDNLIESELFGYKKGAFTGADHDKIGKLERADNGVLFLDEIGDMSVNTQAKLLRVLQFKTFSPLGGNEEKRVNVRFITATNKDLKKELHMENFRQDLFYRINEIPVFLPPLRERKKDILKLLHYFKRTFYNENLFSFSRDAEETLIQYDFPGNIRELKNFIKRLIAISNAKTIDNEILLEIIPEIKDKNTLEKKDEIPKIRPVNYSEFMDTMERDFLTEALDKNDWNISKTAIAIKMQRSNLYKKMKKYNLTKNDTN
ncbi:sigma-54-dependent Fis family transcriptional regulator [bacterium]|nr:sigma-54-dependent Fis family transcriptional regulator [bacterium]